MTTQEKISTAPSAASVSDLSLRRERDRSVVNMFLEANHPLGGVSFWHAAWTARFKDTIVACIVIGRPRARMADDGTEANIYRLGLREDRPVNTGSWLIGQVRDWCRLEGYETLSAHAGISGNYGTVYEAAGFECADIRQADGAGWQTHSETRETWDDYERRKWVYHFDGSGTR